jgi:archaellum component FlaC
MSGLRLNGPIAAIDPRFNGLSDDVSEISSDLAGLSGSVSEISADLSEVTGDVVNITSLVDVVSGDVSGLTDGLAALSGTVTGISDGLGEVTSDVGTLNGQVSALSTSVTDVSNDLTALTTDVGNKASMQDVAGDLVALTQQGEERIVPTTAALAAPDGASKIGAMRTSPGATYLDLLTEIRAGAARPDQFDLSGPDNAPAINRAANAAREERVGLDLNSQYTISTDVEIPEGVKVTGRGMNRTGITSSAPLGIHFLGKEAEIEGIYVRSTHSNRVAMWGIDVDGPSVSRCAIDGRIYFRNQSGVEKRGLTVDKCYFPCNFGADYDGETQMDVITALGYLVNQITSNWFDVDNVNRLVKVSDWGPSYTPQVPSLTNALAFSFVRNFVRGKGGKQVIDLYMGSSDADISYNHWALSDEVGLAGKRWTCVIENKTDANQRDVRDIGAAMTVVGNKGYIGSARFVEVQGAYGITQSGYTGDRYNAVKLESNNIRRTVDSDNPLVDIRFCNHVATDKNTWEIPIVADRNVAAYSSNEYVDVGSGDVYRGGNVIINSVTSNYNGSTFSGVTGTVKINAPTVADFDCDGAIQTFLLQIDMLHIEGLISRPAPAPTKLCRAFITAGTVSARAINLIGIDATHPTGGAVTAITDAASAAAMNIVRDNSWQPKVRGYAAAIPTVGTHLRGDIYWNSAPAFNTPSGWMCVTAGTPGVWREISTLPAS